MREPNRATAVASAPLDEVSDHMGEVLRRADELLADWSRFGASVRAQVQQEAATIGQAVATSVDDAVLRATAAALERALGEQVNRRLAALTSELATLEARARETSRALAEERIRRHRLLGVVIAGIVLANVLLVILIFRRPVASAAPPSLPSPALVPAAAHETAVPLDAGEVPSTSPLHDSGVDDAPDASADPKADAEPDAVPDMKPDAKPDAEPDAKPDAGTGAVPASKASAPRGKTKRPPSVLPPRRK